MKTPKISKSDFRFMPVKHGHYKVTYTSPVTFKEWTKVISYMPMIDATKNAENPKIKDLTQLKRICKL